MTNNICRMNRITPFQGLNLTGYFYHRALPYANDNGLSAHISKKAESLLINSVGQRPTVNNGMGQRPTNNNSVGYRPTVNNSVRQRPTFNNEQYNNKRKKLNIK